MRKRDRNALLQISKHWKIEKYMIITKEKEEVIVENGIEIVVLPVWKWLLDKVIN